MKKGWKTILTSLTSLLLGTSLLLSVSHAEEYIMEHPIIGDPFVPESVAPPAPTNPGSSDGKSRYLLASSYKADRTLWKACLNNNCSGVNISYEIRNYEGNVLHFSPTGIPSEQRSWNNSTGYLGVLEDGKSLIYWSNYRNNRLSLPSIYKLDLETGISTQLGSVSVSDSTDYLNANSEQTVYPSTVYTLPGGTFAIRYGKEDDDGDHLREVGLDFFNPTTSPPTRTSLAWSSYDDDAGSETLVVRSTNGNIGHIGQVLNGTNGTVMKIWKIANGISTYRMTTNAFGIGNDDSLREGLVAIGDGFAAYMKRWDQDDDVYREVGYYVNGTRIIYSTEDDFPGELNTEGHFGFAVYDRNNLSKSKIYRKSDGQEVFTSNSKSWSGGDDEIDYTVIHYNETEKTTYVFYENGGDFGSSSKVYKQSIDGGGIYKLFYQGTSWGEAFMTKDLSKMVWKVTYPYGANKEMYWLGMGDESLHYVLKSSAFDINYDHGTNKFFSPISSTNMEVTFSPLAMMDNIEEIVRDIIEENQIGNEELQLIKDAVMDGSGNTALSISQEIQSMISEGGILYEKIEEATKELPVIKKIKESNNKVVVNSSSVNLTIYYSNATGYQTSVDDGAWSEWATLTNGINKTKNIPVSGLDTPGMHVIHVQLRNGTGGKMSMGKIILYKE